MEKAHCEGLLPPLDSVRFQSKQMHAGAREQMRTQRKVLIARVTQPQILDENRFRIVDEYSRIDQLQRNARLAAMNPESAHGPRRVNDKIGFQICTNYQLRKAKEKEIFFYYLIAYLFKTLKAKELNQNAMLKDPDQVVAENQIYKVSALYLYQKHFIMTQRIKVSRYQRRARVQEYEKQRQNQCQERLQRIRDQIAQICRKDVQEILISREKDSNDAI